MKLTHLALPDAYDRTVYKITIEHYLSAGHINSHVPLAPFGQ